jgi:hypothetical protein
MRVVTWKKCLHPVDFLDTHTKNEGAVEIRQKGRTLMAKKAKKGGKKVRAKEATRPVRLDLAVADCLRLEDCARRKGLSMASYARMAVLEAIRKDEAER